MEVVREAWILLEEQVLPLGDVSEAEGPPGCALPAPRLWCTWRDLGRLAKRPSAIILNSGEIGTQKNQVKPRRQEPCIIPVRLRSGF